MEIIGHQKIINLLDRAIAKDAVSHAYLFSGPESVGKFTVALDFAERLIGNIDSISSDLISIKPEIEENKGVIKKLDIKIEAIRNLLHKLSLTSVGGRYKVVIIDDADRLNRTAQNALLKTLEEPNAKVVLILVCQDERKLLPTIISRCQKMRFGLVKEAEIEKIVP
ncbi:MAG: DNA polymerase III subunit delta', partial [Candidatus Moranbacteria bacterium CG23_combo_of_CG06-09_8_20_14_all_39_10]